MQSRYFWVKTGSICPKTAIRSLPTPVGASRPLLSAFCLLPSAYCLMPSANCPLHPSSFLHPSVAHPLSSFILCLPTRRIGTEGGVVGARHSPQGHGRPDPVGNAVPLRATPTAPCATAIQSNLSERSRRSSERSGGGGDPAVFAAQSPIPTPQSPAPTPLLQNFKVPRKNALMIRDFGAIL